MSQTGPSAEAKKANEAAKLELEAAQRRKRTIDTNLANLEASIWAFEGSYLDETAASGGNIIKGFDNYLKPPGVPKTKKVENNSEVDRLFSTSSVTFQQSLADRKIQFVPPPRSITTCFRPMPDLCTSVAGSPVPPRSSSSGRPRNSRVGTSTTRHVTNLMFPPPIPASAKRSLPEGNISMPKETVPGSSTSTVNGFAGRDIPVLNNSSSTSAPNSVSSPSVAAQPLAFNPEQLQHFASNLSKLSSSEIRNLCAALESQGYTLPVVNETQAKPAATPAGNATANAKAASSVSSASDATATTSPSDTPNGRPNSEPMAAQPNSEPVAAQQTTSM